MLAGAAMLCACTGDASESGQADLPTIVSLNPCIDAILVEVAEPERILALSHYSRDPSASSMDVGRAYDFGVTGGTAEEVLALRPDIVLASSFMEPATRAALERAGLEVRTFGSPSSVGESVEQIRQIASLAGNAAAGEALVSTLENSTPPSAPESPSAILWQPGQIVAGEASLVAEHLRWAGFRNHASSRGLGQADHVTLEQVMADPPDLLLVAGEAPGQDHPLLEKLEGTHVVPFDPGLFYCAGPSIAKARSRLLQIRAEIEGDRP